MKTLLVVNPASGNGNTGRGWRKSERLLRRDLRFPFDVAMTDEPGHATHIVRKAVSRGVERIVSVGGDGTLNEVINGLFSDENPQSAEPIVGSIGLGTGSDFVKTLGWSPGLDPAIEKLNRCSVKRIDAAHVRFRMFNGTEAGRMFINVADFGAGGAVVKRVNRTTKRFGGAVSFLWGIVATFLTYKNKRIHYHMDQRSERSEILSNVILGNGRFYGGGIKATPSACLDSGTLSIVFVGDFKLFETLVNLPRFRAGRHLTHRKVHHTFAGAIRAHSDEPVIHQSRWRIGGDASSAIRTVAKSRTHDRVTCRYCLPACKKPYPSTDCEFQGNGVDPTGT